MTEFLGRLADALLVIAALYVSGQALRGYLKECQAEGEEDPDVQSQLEEDAKTLYAAASLSLPWVLIFIFAGTLLKAGLMVWNLVSPHVT